VVKKRKGKGTRITRYWKSFQGELQGEMKSEAILLRKSNQTTDEKKREKVGKKAKLPREKRQTASCSTAGILGNRNRRNTRMPGGRNETGERGNLGRIRGSWRKVLVLTIIKRNAMPKASKKLPPGGECEKEARGKKRCDSTIGINGSAARKRQKIW